MKLPFEKKIKQAEKQTKQNENKQKQEMMTLMFTHSVNKPTLSRQYKTSKTIIFSFLYVIPVVLSLFSFPILYMKIFYKHIGYC